MLRNKKILKGLHVDDWRYRTMWIEIKKQDVQNDMDVLRFDEAQLLTTEAREALADAVQRSQEKPKGERVVISVTKEKDGAEEFLTWKPAPGFEKAAKKISQLWDFLMVPHGDPEAIMEPEHMARTGRIFLKNSGEPYGVRDLRGKTRCFIYKVDENDRIAPHIIKTGDVEHHVPGVIGQEAMDELPDCNAGAESMKRFIEGIKHYKSRVFETRWIDNGALYLIDGELYATPADAMALVRDSEIAWWTVFKTLIEFDDENYYFSNNFESGFIVPLRRVLENLKQQEVVFNTANQRVFTDENISATSSMIQDIMKDSWKPTSMCISLQEHISYRFRAAFSQYVVRYSRIEYVSIVDAMRIVFADDLDKPGKLSPQRLSCILSHACTGSLRGTVLKKDADGFLDLMEVVRNYYAHMYSLSMEDENLTADDLLDVDSVDNEAAEEFQKRRTTEFDELLNYAKDYLVLYDDVIRLALRRSVIMSANKENFQTVDDDVFDVVAETINENSSRDNAANGWQWKPREFGNTYNRITEAKDILATTIRMAETLNRKA